MRRILPSGHTGDESKREREKSLCRDLNGELIYEAPNESVATNQPMMPLKRGHIVNGHVTLWAEMSANNTRLQVHFWRHP